MNRRTQAALRRMAAQEFPDADTTLTVLRALRVPPTIECIATRVVEQPPQPMQAGAVLTRRRALVVVGASSAALVASVSAAPWLAGPPASAATPPLLRFTPLPLRSLR